MVYRLTVQIQIGWCLGVSTRKQWEQWGLSFISMPLLHCQNTHSPHRYETIYHSFFLCTAFTAPNWSRDIKADMSESETKLTSKDNLCQWFTVTMKIDQALHNSPTITSSVCLYRANCLQQAFPQKSPRARGRPTVKSLSAWGFNWRSHGASVLTSNDGSVLSEREI